MTTNKYNEEVDEKTQYMNGVLFQYIEVQNPFDSPEVKTSRFIHENLSFSADILDVFSMEVFSISKPDVNVIVL